MLKDAANASRREDFRTARKLVPKMSFEDYVRWLSKITRLFPESKSREFVPYRKILL